MAERGAPQPYSGGIAKLAPDGSRLEFLGGGIYGFLSMRSDARVVVAGTTFYDTFHTTSGVVGPNFPTKSAQDFQSNAPYGTGVIALYDTSAMTGENFFVAAPSSNTSVTWRIGEPAPKDTTLPLLFNGNPLSLILTTSNPALKAALSPSTSTINFNLVPDPNLLLGTTKETVTVTDASNSAKTVAIPVGLTVQPQLTFTLDTKQVNIRIRSGQVFPGVNVGITENFGSEYASLTDDPSPRVWLSSYIDQNTRGRATLSIQVGAMDPGTYDGTITIGINGLQNGEQIVNVHYVVDPPVPIQLSTTTLNVHIVNGQAVRPATIDVTSAVPGVAFSLFVGYDFSWMQPKTIGTTTPGKIQFTFDSLTAVPGIYTIPFQVSGETGQPIKGVLNLDVATGAPLDVIPAAINYTWTRNFPQPFSPFITFDSPSPVTVTWTADQPWILQGYQTLVTPMGVYVPLDTTLPEGVYTGSIKLSAGSYKTTIPVTMSLYDAPHLVFSTTPITFNYQMGGPLPAAQTLQVTSPTLKPGFFDASTFDRFIIVDPGFGSTPITVTLTANPAGLPPGTHSTNLRIAPSSGTIGAATLIPVTLNITTDPNGPGTQLSSVVDAANFLGGSVSPGELVVLFGSQLGPSNLTFGQPDSSEVSHRARWHNREIR